MSHQKLTTLEPLEGLTELTSLKLYNNQLTLEDEKSQVILKSMQNLTELNLMNNKVTNITAINSLKNLKILNLQGGQNKVNLVEIEDIISNLGTLFQISQESLNTIVNCDASKITKLNLDHNNNDITKLPDLSKFTKLKELSLYNNANIANLDIISKLTNLEILNLGKTNLHEKIIDFSKLTNLTKLDLSDNTLWDEDLESLKSLKNNMNLTINLSNNSIINATALLELDRNTNIKLSGNVNLTQKAKDELKARFETRVTF